MRILAQLLVPVALVALSGCKTAGSGGSGGAGVKDDNSNPGADGFVRSLEGVGCVASASAANTGTLPGGGALTGEFFVTVKDGVDAKACALQIVEALPGTTYDSVNQDVHLVSGIKPPDGTLTTFTGALKTLRGLSCVSTASEDRNGTMPGSSALGTYTVTVKPAFDFGDCVTAVRQALPGATIAGQSAADFRISGIKPADAPVSNAPRVQATLKGLACVASVKAEQSSHLPGGDQTLNGDFAVAVKKPFTAQACTRIIGAAIPGAQVHEFVESEFSAGGLIVSPPADFAGSDADAVMVETLRSFACVADASANPSSHMPGGQTPNGTYTAKVKSGAGGPACANTVRSGIPGATVQTIDVDGGVELHVTPASH